MSKNSNALTMSEIDGRLRFMSEAIPYLTRLVSVLVSAADIEIWKSEGIFYPTAPLALGFPFGDTR
jgi:hypothetical protein